MQINMRGLDGVQGPVYVGTGCVFRRQALYGYEPPKGPKRPKMVSCDCCPCFGRRKKLKNSKSGVDGDAAGESTFFQISIYVVTCVLAATVPSDCVSSYLISCCYISSDGR